MSTRCKGSKDGSFLICHLINILGLFSYLQYFQDPSLAPVGQRLQQREVFSQDGEVTAREPETLRAVNFTILWCA